MKKFLVILLCAALLCGILPVSAAGSGHFFLTVVTAGRTLVAPCAIKYEAGQTLREALLAAGADVHRLGGRLHHGDQRRRRQLYDIL